MCGVSGVFSKGQIEPDIIQSMTYVLDHRGPDARGTYLNKSRTVALGHTRLSVIDPGNHANQPFGSADGRYVVVFNGEIYNYSALKEELIKANGNLTWRTHSDTEVVLNGFIHWGHKICQKLDGMFAFAVYHEDTNEIFLGRDRTGKKPLFYYHKNGCFVFASEIKSLLKHPLVAADRDINVDAIYTFLHLGYIPETQTAYRSIKKFPASHYAKVKNDSVEFTAYFDLQSHCLTSRSMGSSSRDRVKATLSGAIEKRLISDVPVGAFLSGGTDSSLVVALAAEQRSPTAIKTYNIGFKGAVFDESVYSSKVATVLKTDHKEYVMHEDDAVGFLETFLSHFDEPFADTSAIPMMLVSRLARQEVKVALTGDGGDELFLGYGAYDWANRLASQWVKGIQTPLSYALSRFGSSRLKRIGCLLEKVRSSELRSHIFSQEQYFFSRSEIFAMCVRESPDFYSINYSDPECTDLTSAEKQALFDLVFYLRDDLLTKVDRASMYFGLECRCPFLDPEVISAAWSLPYNQKRRGTERKAILKDILEDYLPKELIYRPKWGFSIPLARWMKNEFAYLINDYLNDSMVRDVGLVKYSAVSALKKAFSHGDDFLYHRLWVLIVTHKWLYENDRR